ncbi:MAG TPA: pilus assembly protein N-terminal domain-containing protein, partial [Beijerinckiaceae bacterium]|nr:pilus assembly protein N-terminal domain-containing protein [Beijerinckiaceae bacterium]
MSRLRLNGADRFDPRARLVALAAPLVALLFLVLAGAASAQTRLVEIGENKVGGVRVVQGKSQTLRTTIGFVDLVVGDPDIADVMPLTDRTLYVLGRKLGVTNVSVYDAGKQLVGVIEVEVAYDAPRIAADIERSAPGNGARVTTANGRTVLSGEVDDPAAAERAVAIARHYGPEIVNEMKVRSPQQVMLEVRFVEASRNAGKELGIGFEAAGRNFGSPNRSHLNLAGITGLAGLASGAVPFGAAVGRVLSSGVQADI